MAHFAEIDENNIVLRVIVVSNEDMRDQYGNENEVIGSKFCHDLLGGTWIQTSYNTLMGEHRGGGTPLRKNYAGIGYSYDTETDAFYAPKPFDSWILNKEKYVWEPPVSYPNDEKLYVWDENAKSWVEPNA